MNARLRVALLVCSLAVSGCLHAHTGPVIGYAIGEGPAVGWEAGAGMGPVSGTFGTEVRPFGERVAEFYAAGEPAVAVPIKYDQFSPTYPDRVLSLGGTAGFTVDEHGDGGFVGGGFAGVPWVTSGDCRKRNVAATTISVMVGVHVFVDGPDQTWTLYATPKIGKLASCPDLRPSGSFKQ